VRAGASLTRVAVLAVGPSDENRPVAARGVTLSWPPAMAVKQRDNSRGADALKVVSDSAGPLVVPVMQVVKQLGWGRPPNGSRPPLFPAQNSAETAEGRIRAWGRAPDRQGCRSVALASWRLLRLKCRTPPEGDFLECSEDRTEKSRREASSPASLARDEYKQFKRK